MVRWANGAILCAMGLNCALGADFATTGFAAENQAAESKKDARIAELAKEVRTKGWIVSSAKTANGDWDLFLTRPDGSQQRNITNTPDSSEAAPRFSPDGKRMLFRRLPKGATISHDRWGFQGQLIVANADGSKPVEFGKEREFTWAAWNPNGMQLSCLSTRGIETIDARSKKVLRKLDRKGVFQQLFWSPDGKNGSAAPRTSASRIGRSSESTRRPARGTRSADFKIARPIGFPIRGV